MDGVEQNPTLLPAAKSLIGNLPITNAETIKNTLSEKLNGSGQADLAPLLSKLLL